MLAAEASNGEWAIGFDGLYMDLSKDGEVLATKYDGYQAGLELTGFWKLTPFFEVLAGGRLNLMGASVTSPSSVTLVDKNKTWFDPFIGARFTVPNTGKWIVMLRGDVGGFGVGSQFAWQVRPRWPTGCPSTGSSGSPTGRLGWITSRGRSATTTTSSMT